LMSTHRSPAKKDRANIKAHGLWAIEKQYRKIRSDRERTEQVADKPHDPMRIRCVPSLSWPC
jgi:hypothetical protein